MASENQPRVAAQTVNHPDKNSGNSKLVSLLDVVAKLLTAGAVVSAAVIANQFQSSMATTTLLSQREQADSALRASMFRDLIGPVVGSKENNGEIPVEREQLFVELLALNFHENFELKPLMLRVDGRLARAHNQQKKTGAHTEDARESLQSVARRVIQRQVAMLTKGETNVLPGKQAVIYWLDMREAPPTRGESEPHPAQAATVLSKYFDDLFSIDSPNGNFTLTLSIYKPNKSNWDNQHFRVLISIAGKKTADAELKQIITGHDFDLTWFDFPFTDNTLLADGTRFSLVMEKIDPVEKKAMLKLIWFPQDYFAARERPTNYNQFREKLGLSLD